jgi:DNA-binding MarR family transcriptional regulator
VLDFENAPIGRLLGFAGRLVGQRFQQVLDAEGLTHAGWQVLLVLSKTDRLTQREVAERVYVTQATVTGVMDTLERDNYVIRERDGADRRVVRVSLTLDGRLRLERAMERVSAEMRPLFEDMTVREEAVVRRFLARTMRRLGAESTGEPPR